MASSSMTLFRPLPRLIPLMPSKIVPQKSAKPGYPFDELPVEHAADIFPLRRRLRGAVTAAEILDFAQQYHEMWKDFAHQIELRRLTLTTPHIITYHWKTPDAVITEEYSSSVIRFESIMAAVCYAQHLYAKARKENDTQLFMKAYHVFEFDALDNRKAWATACDVELPFEATYSGIVFYMKLCLYGVQRVEVLRECKQGLFIPTKSTSMLAKGLPEAYEWPDERLEALIAHASSAMQMLEALVYCLRGFSHTSQGIAYAHSCLDEDSLANLSHDLTLMICIVGFCVALRYDKRDYRVKDAYISYLVTDHVSSYKGVESRLLMDLFESIKREKRASDALRVTRSVPVSASSATVTYEPPLIERSPHEYIRTAPTAQYSKKIQRDKHYFITNTALLQQLG